MHSDESFHSDANYETRTHDIIEDAIKLFSKLPGSGPRSARRTILHLLKTQSKISDIIKSLAILQANVAICSTCSNISANKQCEICTSPIRNNAILCIVEDVDDLWNLERTKTYKGMYHVLGGKLSAVDNILPHNLNIDAILQRLSDSNSVFEEIIFANNLSPQSQTTVFYILEQIRDLQKSGKIKEDLKITELAHGIPIGSNFEYMDDGTILASFNSRRVVS